MQDTRDFLASLGLPRGDAYDLPTSSKRFPDGAQYRVEIPSVEGPRALAAVLEEGERQKVLIQRVSQGSGIMLLNDAEIREMAVLGHDAGIEVSLFVGPRAAWETSAQAVASAGKNLGARHRGMDQVVYAVEDIRRACGLGIRSVLVADEGLLWLASEMKRAGKLPANLVLKVSVQMGAANPISVRWMEQLGAGHLQRADRPDAAADGCDSPGGVAAARCLRRGAGRLRRLHPPLRSAGDGARGRADVRQARPAQRAEHLSQRHARREHGGRAGAGARPSRWHCLGDDPPLLSRCDLRRPAARRIWASL